MFADAAMLNSQPLGRKSSCKILVTFFKNQSSMLHECFFMEEVLRVKVTTVVEQPMVVELGEISEVLCRGRECSLFHTNSHAFPLPR